MRKIFIPIVALVLLVAAGGAWWFLSQKETPPQAEVTGTLPPGGGEDPGATGTPGGIATSTQGTTPSTTAPATGSVLTKISDSPVVAYAQTRNGNIRIVEKSGQISLVSRSGEATTESSNTFENVSHAFFLENGAKAVVSFGKPGTRQTSVFDASTKKWSALPSGITSLAPSPSDSRVAYATETGAGTTIALLDLKTPGQKPKPIYSLSALDLVLDWFAPNSLQISERPSAWYENSSWNLSLSSLALTPLISEERGIMARWNTSGTLGFLFSSEKKLRGGTSRLISPTERTIRSFSFLSFPSKCDFSVELVPLPPRGTSTARVFREEEFLYCAIPTDQQSLGTIALPDTYLQKSIFTQDVFYRISLVDGGATKFFSPLQPTDADRVRVASGSIYFVNRYNELLYALSLPK